MINEIFNNIWVKRILLTIIVLIISSIMYSLISKFLTNKIEKGHFKLINNKKSKTVIRLIKNIIRYITIIITVLIIFQIYGINISSMVAGVGVISIIIGFAIQDALKDIIKGVDILSEGYYQVGDIIKLGSNTAKVLSIGLKTTKMQDMYTLNIVSVSNRNIETVEVVSNLINIDIPLPYELKVTEAEKVIANIVNKIKKQKDVDDCEYRGLNDLAASSLNYQIKVYCNPVKKIQVRRDALGIIMKTLNELNISVPYNQLDIHQN